MRSNRTGRTINSRPANVGKRTFAGLFATPLKMGTIAYYVPGLLPFLSAAAFFARSPLFCRLAATPRHRLFCSRTFLPLKPRTAAAFFADDGARLTPFVPFCRFYLLLGRVFALICSPKYTHSRFLLKSAHISRRSSPQRLSGQLDIKAYRLNYFYHFAIICGFLTISLL